MFRQLADEYPYTEWGKRAAQRLQRHEVSVPCTTSSISAPTR